MNHVSSALQSARHVLITTHVNPDGDAVGSALGLHHALRSRGIHTTIFLPSSSPVNLKWMPDADMMKVWNGSDEQRAAMATCDVIAVLDLNSVGRLGTLGEAIAASTATIVNIDHHTHPESFATHAWIDTDAPATCSMLAEMIMGWEGAILTPHAAQCLYVGIMTDTGSFRYPRTTSKIFHLAADLVELGADPVQAYDRVMNANPFQRSLLLGRALAGLRTHYDGKLCTMVVTKEDMRETHCHADDTEGFVQQTLSIDGVTMGIFFLELDDVVKASFRSKGNTYVRDLAATYGGGGHVYAAGARLYGMTIQEAIEHVVAAAATALDGSTSQ
jgi:bifunctional oligoribonuclease and PAP phosphatase NrnA